MEFLPIKKDGSAVYAGFWKRFGASLVDSFVLFPFGVILILLENIYVSSAISNPDAEQYQSSASAWYGAIETIYWIWFWCEVIVLLFNERKRAIHDFIAGTVVIHKRFAK